jgi:DnaJ-class molecular chaperone
MPTECDNCHGTGEIVYLNENGIWEGHPCSKCKGVGYIINIDEKVKIYVFIATFWIGIISLIYHTCN